jgi:hypothetical protein
VKIEGRSSTIWLNTLILAFGLTLGSFVAAAAQENSPLGCWRHESAEGRYRNFFEICLGEGGKAEIVRFEDGRGWGQNVRWQTGANSTLSLFFLQL